VIESPFFDIPVYLRVGTSPEREIGSINVRPDQSVRLANKILADLLRSTADQLDGTAQ
jgi:hypothetical protein